MKMDDIVNNYDGIWRNLCKFGVNCDMEEDDLDDAHSDFNNKPAVTLTNPAWMMDMSLSFL